MTYNEALDYIRNTKKFAIKPGLHNMTELLKQMGNPHKKLKCIHIAGTNGKGSTAAFINNILIESGYKTGMFTSPYIQSMTERIKINNAEIEESQLARLVEFVKDNINFMLERGGCQPTRFEVITAMAFQYFYEQDCDVVVLEVGLGGRYDSTNVIDTPDLGVITAISYDHMKILGNTIEEITWEKAGIIKEKGDIVAYLNPVPVTKIIEQTCKGKNANLYMTDFQKIKNLKQDIEGQTFDFEEYKALKIILLGEHQVKNAAVSVYAAKILINKNYNITEESIRRGLLKTRWPGRLEFINRDPDFIIDGAHNVGGAEALKKAIETLFPDKKVTFIIGVLKDKDYRTMFKRILPGCKKVYAVTPDNGRALPASDLAEEARKYCNDTQICDTVRSAVEKSLAGTSKKDVICAFGSLSYIGEIRKILGTPYKTV